jgi:hypothetical protein
MLDCEQRGESPGPPRERASWRLCDRSYPPSAVADDDSPERIPTQIAVVGDAASVLTPLGFTRVRVQRRPARLSPAWKLVLDPLAHFVEPEAQPVFGIFLVHLVDQRAHVLTSGLVGFPTFVEIRGRHV